MTLRDRQTSPVFLFDKETISRCSPVEIKDGIINTEGKGARNKLMQRKDRLLNSVQTKLDTEI